MAYLSTVFLLLLITVFNGCFVTVMLSFRAPLRIYKPSIQSASTITMGYKSGSMYGKNIVAKTILAALFTISPLQIDHKPMFSQLVQPANAEFRAAQKRTYFRFVPKLIEGRDFYKNDLKAAIDSDKWDVVTKFFETYVSKYNPNDPNQVDATDTYVNVHFFRPMTVWSGSFAERGSSAKQRLLLDQIDAFKVAMDDLEGCVKNRNGGGFFASEIKMPTGQAKKNQVESCYDYDLFCLFSTFLLQYLPNFRHCKHGVKVKTHSILIFR